MHNKNLWHITKKKLVPVTCRVPRTPKQEPLLFPPSVELADREITYQGLSLQSWRGTVEYKNWFYFVE